MTKAQRALVEAYRLKPTGTDAMLLDRARRASKNTVLAQARDDDAPNILVRSRDGRTLHLDGDEVARVDHEGTLVAKRVGRAS